MAFSELYTSLKDVVYTSLNSKRRVERYEDKHAGTTVAVKVVPKSGLTEGHLARLKASAHSKTPRSRRALCRALC